MHTANGPPIKSTAFSLDILEVVHELGTATLSDIVDEFDKPKSTVHDHVATLLERGYLVKQGDKSYRLSVRSLGLGGRIRSRFPLFQVAEGEIRDLAMKTDEHANLLIEENGKGVFLYKIKGTDSVTLDTYEGMEVYLHTTALGKAILSELPVERRDAIVEKHGLPAVTSNTITDRDVLRDELDEIRDRGYAIDNEERIPGIRCVAAPISNDGRVAGAVSISAPRNRMSDDRFENDIPAEVLKSANVIEVNLRHV